MKLVLVVAFLALALLPGAAQPAPDTARMDQIIQGSVGDKQFMGAVLVARDGQVVFEKAYGAANLEWDVANTTDTRFRLGSLTKQFTAASILLLEERGKLKLDDPVKTYLPDAPASWDKVTLYNLLTHTSGIPNMTEFDNFKEVTRKTWTPAELIADFRDRSLDFQPGEKFHYSNSGYLVLGAIIEKVAGVPYVQFLQDNILTPLGMKDTGYDSWTQIIPKRASGYVRRKGQLVNDDFIDMSIPYSAGALYSTTHDLWTWEKALHGGKLLKPASLKKMTTPFKEDYGFGVIIHDDGGHKQISHAGGINGFGTALAWYPQDRIAIVVLDNIGGSGAAYTLMTQLAAVTLGRPVVLASERKEVPADPRVLARYAGRYQMPMGVMEISQDGDHLFAQMGKQPKLPIFMESEGTFFTRQVDAQITFTAAGDQPATAMVLHQGGRDMTAPRLP